MIDIKTKLIRGLVISLVSLGLLIGAYFYGRADQRAVCDNKQLVSEVKGMREHEYMEREVRQLDELNLDTVLDHWMQ